MKTLKSMLASIALITVCFVANATVKPVADKPTKTDVVNMYIDAISHGKINNLNAILDESLQFNIQRGVNVNTLDKDQLLEYLKDNTNGDVPVSTNTTIVHEDDNSYIVKVDFKYSSFTRSDLVTVEYSSGWLITKVQSSYK